jgi:hypothetical protein
MGAGTVMGLSLLLQPLALRLGGYLELSHPQQGTAGRHALRLDGCLMVPFVPATTT